MATTELATSELEATAGERATATARPVSASVRTHPLLARLVGDRVYGAARSIYRLARGPELRVPIPLPRKLAAWSHGFLAEHAAMYERTSDAFARGERDGFLTDVQRRYRCVRLNPDRSLFDNKIGLRALLATRGVAQPETIALIADGRVLLAPLASNASHADASELERLMLADGGRFVVKPNNGTRGAGIFLVETHEGALVRRHGSARQAFRLVDCERLTLIERFVEQHPFWRDLAPGCANGIRAVTMWTPGERAPFLARAVQRIGTADTAPTDNWSGGGVGAAIDLETGRMGVGRLHPLKCGARANECSRHPDNGAQIEGAVLPHWDRIRDAVLAAAASFPFNRYVGWDVVIDRDGTPVFLEGNANPDVNGLQVHGGLLAEPRIRRFYEACGVI